MPDESSELDDALEVVRQSFYARLHDEKARLSVLVTALESCEAESVTGFQQLETFAHRLRGAAAVFDAFELCEAAKALELAAAAASAGRVPCSDVSVRRALHLLTNRLASLTGSEPPPHEAPIMPRSQRLGET
jgi:HPt (histidine-containing phosphotransfer) domain-containing protein